MSRYPALARNGIPFRWSHTPELARRLNRIARAGAAVLGAAGGGRSIEMIEKMRRRTIMASCQLEGNPLDEMDVAALLAGRVIPGPFTVQPEHAREITNYRDALDHSLGLADAHRPVRIPDFCAIQDRLMRGLLPAEACGRIRSVPMATYYVETGEKIADAPEPDELRELLDEAGVWLDDTAGENPALRAFAFHFIGREIHPFVEGNRRSSRLMQQLLLLRGGVECARYASPEFEILEDPRLRMEFPRVIAESRQMDRIEPFLELMAESLARAVERVAAEAQAQATPSVAPTRSRSSEPNVEAVEPEVEARPEDADFSLD